jgi:hypothetical protein
MQGAHAPLDEERTMMRFGLAALALLGLAACSPGKVEVSSGNGETITVNGRGGYTLQVVGAEKDQVYIVTAPDGRSAAARVTDGVSAIMGTGEAQNMVAAQQAALGPDPGDGGDDVHISVPGFSLKVRDGDAEGSGRSSVKMKAAGFDLDVNADESAGAERAVVRIGGADEKSAREFIDNADGLSAEVRAQMREALGL